MKEVYIPSTDGKNKLHVVIWEPNIQVIGVVQISHANSARTAHPFQRNGAPFRFKLSKAQQVN